MSRSKPYPSPDDLLPHSGRMNLLAEAVEHTANTTTCRFRADVGHVFERDGAIPVWFGIEIMGQCAFYHYLLNRHLDGEPEKQALFLGGRRIRVHASEFQPDIPYIVYAKHIGTNDRYFVATGRIYPEGDSSDPRIEGRLSALLIDRDENLLGDHRERFS